MTPWLQAGDVTIHRVVEMEVPFMPALDMLPGLTPDMLDGNRHWLQPAALDAEDRLILCIQSFVVRTPHHTILVDSCVGNDKQRPARPNWHVKRDDRFTQGLAALELGLDDIDFVLCTHLHADHVGWNTRLLDGRWVPTFPRARYVFGADEYAYWQGQHAGAPNPVFADSVLPIIEAGRAELVGSDHALGDHVRLLPTPGHTPGHFSVALGAKAIDAVVSGDVIHSPLQARHPELSIRFDLDQQAAAQTRRGFLDRFCDTGTLCCMTHFPSPSVGRLTRWGDGFRCEAVEAATA